MDRLLSFTKNSSEISQDYYPPIKLDSNGCYVLGLYSLNTYNTIANVIRGFNDCIILERKDNDKEKLKITLPEGAYEIDQIIEYILNQAKESYHIKFNANLNTQKIEFSSEEVDICFPETNSLGKLLGFSQLRYPAGVEYYSDSAINISEVNEINIECNIINGSYRNGERCQTLYSFYPEVPPGYKISERPNQIIYLPVCVREINNITLRLTSQRGNLINFRGEEISIQLNLKKLF